MTDEDSYRPQSPDFSSLHPPVSPDLPPSARSNAYPLGVAYDASPFFSPHAPQAHPSPSSARRSQGYVPPITDPNLAALDLDPDMARRSSRLAAAATDPVPAAPKLEPEMEPEPMAPVPDHYPPKQSHEPEMPEEPANPSPAAGVEVRTKFPVARIKRIMQADEDVGKVAQVTPIAVSKALELFMISLVTKAAQEARDRSSKRVTASHLKHAVAKDDVLDFLADIISKVPDQPTGRKHEDDGSDGNDPPKRKRGGRRPKEDSD